MYPYFHNIPSYGLMIITAFFVANFFIFIICSKRGIIFWDFLIVECYAVLGAFIGSKLLYLWTVRSEINWQLFFSDKQYFSAYMQGGFVFLGGLIGALPLTLLAQKIHRINLATYESIAGFSLPLGHGIGRIGCFLAGCCYGVESHSFLSVVFPENSLAPANVRLLPIQLIEAFFLVLISCLVFFLYVKKSKSGGFIFYLLAYSVVRFVDEFFRGDVNRGIYKGLSLSQWISLLMIVSVSTYVISKKNNKLKR